MNVGSTTVAIERVASSARSKSWNKQQPFAHSLAIAFLLALTLSATQPTRAQTFTVLHPFTGSPDGAVPYGGVVMDAKGNLYGTTEEGGTQGLGTVFKVTAAGSESVYYSFARLTGGLLSQGTLTRDAKGNLYGTTFYGGDPKCGGGLGCGTVFKIATNRKETVLHTFKDGKDGAAPLAGVILDKKSNLYGTAVAGGDLNCTLGGMYAGCGVVFRLNPAGAEMVLHKFSGPDGVGPEASLVMDTSGNLYGTTFSGPGKNGVGEVFKVSAGDKVVVLHGFAGPPEDGLLSVAGVIRDKAGNLYGTTPEGGTGGCNGLGCGTIFEVSSKGKEKVLYNFTGGTDGGYPVGSLVMDAHGNLYGTAEQYGTAGHGTVYELSATGTLTVLHAFTGGADGAVPNGPLVFDAKGNLYGTASSGGTGGNGTVYKITP